MDLQHEVHQVHLMLEDVIVEMARAIEVKRALAGDLPVDWDGDIEMRDEND